MDLGKLSHAAQRKALSSMLDAALKGAKKDRTATYLRILDVARFFYGSKMKEESYERVKNAIMDPNNKWLHFMDRIIEEADPHVLRTTVMNFGFESFFNGTKTIRKNREIYNCNIPWLILFDPTSACNMHCTGCWAGTYGHRHNLSLEDMDKIVSEGKALGAHLYMLTGGEPLVRKKDVLKLAEMHDDVQFIIFTNSTLIDDAFCEEVVKCGNIMFLLSVEGTEETNDDRRGAGHYQAVMKAMDMLKAHGILFGTSVCYTSKNIEAVTSDSFFNLITEKGARFGFYFHYMPTGSAAVTDLLPTPEQRRYMIDRIRYIRSAACPIEFYPMDFQNDGEFVGGCIAGGRNYFHVNSAGDAEPCVFIHYSDSNIHDKSILEILQSPLFMAYHKGQPFNRNHLRPCPMLENPELLRKMVHDTHAVSTDLEAPEDVDHLCDKCVPYAEKWAPNAQDVWDHQTHNKQAYQNYAPENRY